jgi:hypothetical protein
MDLILKCISYIKFSLATSEIIAVVWMSILLYGCKTLSPTLREEHSLRVLGNGVLRGIFLEKRNEVTGDWRKLHNEELYDLYSSEYIIRVIESRRMRCAAHVARMLERRGAYLVLVGKLGGKRPFGRPRCR